MQNCNRIKEFPSFSTWILCIRAMHGEIAEDMKGQSVEIINYFFAEITRRNLVSPC